MFADFNDMLYLILPTLMFAVTAVHGQNAANQDLLCVDKAMDKCPLDNICKFTCRFHCCNPRGNINIFSIGSVTYLANSSICRSALHDLRFPPGDLKEEDKREVIIRRFHTDDCFLEGSVRYGFSSLNFQSKSCDVFEFVDSRVSEVILDLVSMHSNYMYKEKEIHTQVCGTTVDDSSPKVKFGIYSKWQDCNLAEEGGRSKSKKSTEYKKEWNDTKSAGFQCFTRKTALSVITSIAFSGDAHFLPKYLTVTVNKYENVVLSMDEKVSELDKATVWKKDDEKLLRKQNDSIGRTHLSLMNVREGSSGLYSLSYEDTETEKSGFVQLIVRACPKDKYGDNCSKNCDLCSNGGICHDITGECICAPGFNGHTCESACEPGYLGKKCSIRCVGNSTAETQICKGLSICLPSPYGCSCASGFAGLRCDEECPDHSYGAGCHQQHKHVHYKSGSCSRFFDICDCLNGWHGDSCNESYPVLTYAPSLINVTENSITFLFSKWSNISDIGSGKPDVYEVVYKEMGDEGWKSGFNISAEKVNRTYQVTLPSLKPATEYIVGVAVIDKSGNKQERNISTLNISTLCSAPSAPPSNVKLHPDDSEQCIYVYWKLPSKENWNCREINTVVKVRDSTNSVQEECKRRGNSTCFFYSKPFILWIIEVCAISDGNKENCSKPNNITLKGKIYTSQDDLVITKTQTTVSLTWKQPGFTKKLDHYVISHVDMHTNVSVHFTVRTLEAACGSNKRDFHCYTINDLILDHSYKMEIKAFYVNDKEGQIIQSFEVRLEKSPVSVLVFLGVILPLLLIFCIIAYILYRRRHKKRKSSLRVKFLPSKIESEFAVCNEALDEMDIIETESVGEEISNPISLEKLPEYVKQGIQNTKIRKEFISVPTGQIYPCSAAKLGENKSKNRYGNILPYDHSRVILDVGGDPSSNYIHASYIHGYNKVKKYIATQGPLQNTAKDFWRMIWDEGSCKILMITNVMENGKYKCEKYWTDDSCMYGDINISLEDFTSFADFIVRTFKVSKGNDSREVKQFHFTTWPDHGAPSNATPFRNYLKKTRCYKPDSDAPIIVHCSAGIGRTGTAILLDSMIDMAEQEKQVDLVNHLCSMRKQRMNIVENFDQYVFVYCALVEGLCYKDTSIKASDFKKEFEKLKTIDEHSDMKLIEKQFQELSQLTVELMYKDVQGAYQHENQNKNRSMMFLPPDRARPFLSRDFSDYINAVYVDSFTVKNAFIATQYPLPETIQDFWRMIYEQKSKTVILLQKIDFSKEEMPHLWLPEDVLTLGDLEITWKSVTSKNKMTVINIIISHKDGGIREPLAVNIVILKQWACESNLPTDTSVILSAIHKINSLNSESSSIITVVCIDGVTACGVFCACLYVCDHFKAEQEIDIFHAIKCIRANRPHFILNLAQYQFIFEVISSYLDSYKDSSFDGSD